MQNILLFLLGVPALFVLAYSILYWGMRWINDKNVDAVESEILSTAIVTNEEKQLILNSVRAARKADKKVRLYDFTAPFVVAIALIGRKETDTKLPKWASAWDNNVSINGDGEVVKRDGEWVHLRDIGNAPNPGERVYSYNDIEYDGYAYYDLWGIKLKPRWYIARWLFIGWRNKASQKSVDAGIVLTTKPELVQGDMYINRVNNPGHFLLRCDGQYHYMSIAKFLPLEKVGKGVEKLLTKVFRMVNKNSPSFVFSVSNQIANAFPLALRRSVGYKMEVAYWQELSRRAAAVAINISFKGWKGK